MVQQPSLTSSSPPAVPGLRSRRDRCPGVLRPWPADDGGLLRIRVVGGRLTADQLAGLAALAREYGDGDLHLTTRANVQVRGVALPVPSSLVLRLTDLGLLPSLAHERVRNLLVSPLTGRVGGLADLRPVARALDLAWCADLALADLAGRFLVGLDDRGDLADRRLDLAAVAVDRDHARLLAGGWAGDVVPLAEVPARITSLARRFLDLRGSGPTAAWHVHDLPAGPESLGEFVESPAAAAVPAPSYGGIRQDDGRWLHHRPVPDGVLTPDLVATLLTQAAGSTEREVVATPWRSVVLPGLETAPC